MKIKYLSVCLLTILSSTLISSCSTKTKTPAMPEVKYNELSPIVATKTKLHAREELKLTCDSSDITWSINNDLATIDQEGNLKVGDKDGQFVVTVTSKKDPTFTSNKLFTVKSLNSEELSELVYEAALGQNYTLTWTGKFFNEDGSEVTLEQVKKDDASSTTPLIFEDMTTKGNVIKFTEDAFYWLYGVDGYGNQYEGGSYNSPDGFVYDFSVTGGKVEKGNPDYFSAMLGVPKYQDIYSGDLRYFVKDEFKIEDANLELSIDGSYLVYDALKDENDFKDIMSLSDDHSLSSTIFGIVDSSYGSQFVEYNRDFDATGAITYDEKSMTAKFKYKQINIGETACYDYEATFILSDIGTTEILGIADLIAADKAAIEGDTKK